MIFFTWNFEAQMRESENSRQLSISLLPMSVIMQHIAEGASSSYSDADRYVINSY
jgi:hypothetical protein